MDRALSARDAAEGTGVKIERRAKRDGLIKMTSAKSEVQELSCLVGQGVTITPRRLPMKTKG